MSTASEKLAVAWADVKYANGWVGAQWPLVKTHWGAFLVALSVGVLIGMLIG